MNPVFRFLRAHVGRLAGTIAGMIRIDQIIDPVLQKRVIEALARKQGMQPEDIPHWYEMDDADYSQLLLELNEPTDVQPLEPPKDSRE